MSGYTHTDAEVRIKRAIASMPYGALVHTKVGFKHNRAAPITLDEIATYLEALKDVRDARGRRAATTSSAARK